MEKCLHRDSSLKSSVRKSNALTATPSGRLYSSTELGRLVGFCELQQRSDIH
jgi:hypothetical protein